MDRGGLETVSVKYEKPALVASMTTCTTSCVLLLLTAMAAVCCEFIALKLGG